MKLMFYFQNVVLTYMLLSVWLLVLISYLFYVHTCSSFQNVCAYIGYYWCGYCFLFLTCLYGSLEIPWFTIEH